MGIITSPGRSLAFLIGAGIGSQAPYIPQVYGTYLGMERDDVESSIKQYDQILNPGFLKNLEGLLGLSKDKAYDKKTIENLRSEKKEELVYLEKKLQEFQGSSLPGKLFTMTLDPSGAYSSLGYYKPGFDPSIWKETGVSALIGGIVLLAVYEFLIKRSIKRMFRKNKQPKNGK